MLRISSGYSPEYLLKEVATGRENYYTGAVTEGEPPGRWWGRGAEQLGLTGLVDAQDMRAVFERFLDPRAEGFNDPARWDEVKTLGHAGRRYLNEEQLYVQALEREPDASPERKAELRTEAGKAARHNVAFFDVTFSVQKSVTLLHTAFEAQEVAARNAGDEETAAAWGQFRQAVEDAIWAGNNAALAYLSEKAGYSRVGHHGGAAGRYVDAHDLVVASFFQHDSRDGDPQLHIHNPVLNRTQGPDGKWRTLDGRSLYRWRGAAAAVAERTTEERLTHALGVQVVTRPDGKSREVIGVDPAAMALISSRRHAVTAKAAELIDAFESRYGRSPNGLERDRLAQQATLLTRRAKSHDGVSREELLDRVDAQLRAEVAGGLGGVAHTVLDAREQTVQAQTWSPAAVIETALADVQERKAGWTESDLTRAINAALPDYLGLPEGTDVADLLDTLTREALRSATPLDAQRPGEDVLPDELRLDNGQSAYQAPGGRLYATPEHVHTERALLAASTKGGAAAMPREVAAGFLEQMRESGVELCADQAAAVRGVLTSGSRVETLVGPAGTGKSFVVGTLARAWTDPDLTGGQARRVFGLATSQIATEVLKAEGLTASNVAAWLGTQRRLTTGPGSGGPQPVEGDQAWRLRAGDLVVVDESAMTDTAALAAIHTHVDAAGAKLLLVGDHRQLAAVGAGGGMDLIAASGARYELAEARRFRAPWEREASLRLREADETVLRDYHQHGRVLDAGTAEQAEQSAARAWLGDTLSGRRSLLIVDTNEQAARVSAGVRAELVRLGQVQEHGGVLLGLQGTYAGVGDLVEARRLDWSLAGYEGNPRGAINREHYRVHAVRPDGGLEVAVVTGRTADGDVLGDHLVLPASYVGEHLALGYASTVHAAQGGTVDTTHTVITSSTGPGALYVGMSRGREANTAHVTTTSGVDDPAQGSDTAHSIHRDPTAVLAGILATHDTLTDRSAVAIATESATENEAVRTPGELLADAAQLAATERTVTWLDRLVDHGHLSPAQRAQVAAEDGAPALTRVLRRIELTGQDAEQVLTDAVADRPFTDAHSITNVLYKRLSHGRDLDPAGNSWTDWVPKVDSREWTTYLGSLAQAAVDRTAELGRAAAEKAEEWAVAAFGRPPADPAELTAWTERAGAVAAYHELRGHDPAAVTQDRAASAGWSPAGDVLGPAPQPGQVEAYAAYRSAWRALGRPEVEMEEMAMTDGRLRMRVRAYERETAWAPRFVGHELAGTHQAAATHHHTAALRTAEADNCTDPADRDRLLEEARQAAALAGVLDQRAAQLQELDDARATWLAHTAATRAAGERAKAELAARQADHDDPEEQVTAQDWLDAHRTDQADEDAHRDITDTDTPDDTTTSSTDDTTDNTASRHAEQPAADEESDSADDAAQDVIESADPDLRAVADSEPAQAQEDVVRVPTAEETVDAVSRAQRALAEIQARTALDNREAEQHRAAELAQWQADDAQHTEDDTDTDDSDDGMPTMEDTPGRT